MTEATREPTTNQPPESDTDKALEDYRSIERDGEDQRKSQT